jgi:molecular chaperone DnaK (HSP70)
VLVVDVGGATTNVSIVSDGEVIYSSSMPLGGDTFIDCLAAHLIKDFYGSESINTNESDSVPSMKPKLDDPTALQRLHEASTTSLYELSNKSRSQINIPFLSIDLQTKQPKHLDVGVARSIIDTKVESFIRDKLTCYLLETSSTALSKNLPRPTDLSTLFSSTLASAMEFTSSTPFSFRAVLVVGGGARIPLVKDAMKTGVRNLAGDAFLERLIMPDGEMGEELVVLGAALCGGSGGV